MTWESELSELTNGKLLSFDDKPSWNAPTVSCGVYTVWKGDEFLYVGMSGRNINESNIQILEDQGKKIGLITRLESHASGMRSGDQFCIYVHDFFVLPKIVEARVYKPERGYLDKLTRDHIRENLRYRVKCFQTEDSIQIVRSLEEKIKKGVFGLSPPFLNGIL